MKFRNLVCGEAFIPGKECRLAVVVGDRCLKFALLRGINYPYLKMNVLLYFSFSVSHQSHSGYVLHAECFADFI